jgi:hypothetical protein
MNLSFTQSSVPPNGVLPKARGVVLSQSSRIIARDSGERPDDTIDWTNPQLGIYTEDAIPTGSVIIIERWRDKAGTHRNRAGQYRGRK